MAYAQPVSCTVEERNKGRESGREREGSGGLGNTTEGKWKGPAGSIQSGSWVGFMMLIDG